MSSDSPRAGRVGQLEHGRRDQHRALRVPGQQHVAVLGRAARLGRSARAPRARRTTAATAGARPAARSDPMSHRMPTVRRIASLRYDAQNSATAPTANSADQPGADPGDRRQRRFLDEPPVVLGRRRRRRAGRAARSPLTATSRPTTRPRSSPSRAIAIVRATLRTSRSADVRPASSADRSASTASASGPIRRRTRSTSATAITASTTAITVAAAPAQANDGGITSGASLVAAANRSSKLRVGSRDRGLAGDQRGQPRLLAEHRRAEDLRDPEREPCREPTGDEERQPGRGRCGQPAYGGAVAVGGVCAHGRCTATVDGEHEEQHHGRHEAHQDRRPAAPGSRTANVHGPVQSQAEYVAAGEQEHDREPPEPRRADGRHPAPALRVCLAAGGRLAGDQQRGRPRTRPARRCRSRPRRPAPHRSRPARWPARRPGPRARPARPRRGSSAAPPSPGCRARTPAGPAARPRRRATFGSGCRRSDRTVCRPSRPTSAIRSSGTTAASTIRRPGLAMKPDANGPSTREAWTQRGSLAALPADDVDRDLHAAEHEREREREPEDAQQRGRGPGRREPDRRQRRPAPPAASSAPGSRA